MRGSKARACYILNFRESNPAPIIRSPASEPYNHDVASLAEFLERILRVFRMKAAMTRLGGPLRSLWSCDLHRRVSTPPPNWKL